MRQNAKLLDSRGAGMMGRPLEGLALLAGAAARNPVITGGVTVFLVSMTFVTANAIWYQPHAHETPFFQTRSLDAYKAPELPRQTLGSGGTQIRIEHETDLAAVEPKQAPKPVVTGNPKVARVQDILAALNLYQGEIDGQTGPKTREAVGRYQRIVGLPVTGEISDRLLEQLDGMNSPSAREARVEQASLKSDPAPLPAPRPAKAAQKQQPSAEVTASVPEVSEDLKMIQAGLRAFGNEHIEVDGRLGAKTRMAIKEFQSLFGLAETGEPDGRLLAKMQEIGLVR